MQKSFVVGSVVGAMLVTAVGATAGYKAYSRSRGAEVVAVKQVFRTVSTPRQECHDEQVTRVKPSKDPNRVAGTGIGAVVGGLLGNQVGGGNGRVLATVAGAAAGGYAGNKIEQKVQKGNTETVLEQRCTTVYDRHEEPAGYDVRYLLDGREHRVHMDREPGRYLPVQDGHVLTGPATGRHADATGAT